MPQPPRRKNVRTVVFKAFGLRAPRGKTLGEASHRELHRFLNPYEHARYPTRMAGDKTKLPMEFRRGWSLTLEKILNILNDRELAKRVATDPNIRTEFKKALQEALFERGIRAYEEEWAHLKGKDIAERVVGRAQPQKIGKKTVKPTPWLANEFNARLALLDVRKGISKLKKGQYYTILDIGAGAGGTILPIVERLSPQERSKLRILLVDIMSAGLKEAKEALKKLGLSENQIITVRGNIATMLRYEKLKQYLGKIDLVTSGAAIHHTPDVTPIFKAVYNLLKRGGVFCFWDWGHAAWRAPNLKVAPKGAKVDKTGQYWEKGLHEKEAGPEEAFISRGRTRGIHPAYWAPTELQGVKMMFKIWISLLGYPKGEQQRFVKWFDERVKKGAPINFLEYLKRLEKKKPEFESPFLFWEGHKPPELYQDALMKVGFISERKRPFTIYSTESPLLYQIKIRK